MTSSETVTVLFTDVVGSTQLRTGWGDAVAQKVMRSHYDLVRQQIEKFSGQEVKTIGDSFMIAFRSARRAVDCAIAVQRALEEERRQTPERAFDVRIGLNTGEAIQEEGDYFGAAVDAALRVAMKAKGGQILVSEVARAVIGSAKDLEFLDRGRFRLKGFAERWRLYEVPWQDLPTGATPVLPERTPFIGREDERSALRRLVDAAENGHGALALVGGEAGVGKTRLCQELADEVRSRGFLAITGRCTEMEGAPAYLPFVEMIEHLANVMPAAALRENLGENASDIAKLTPKLQDLFPDIPKSFDLPSGGERRYLFEAIRGFLKRLSDSRPVLLLLDDAHWADESSLFLLEHIAERLAEMRLLILVTFRDDSLSRTHALSRCLEQLGRRQLAHRISLKRFPEVGVAVLLRALSGREPPAFLVQLVYRETDGNPLFVEEVFKHLSEDGKLFDTHGGWRAGVAVSEVDVPETLRLVLRRRLERVSDQCRRALVCAAVIGRSFSFEVLEAVGEVEGDALLDAVDEAERAQIILSNPESLEATFFFGHELIRQTLLSTVSVARRQRLHVRVADAIERCHANSPDYAPELVHHLQSGGHFADSGRVIQASMKAGDIALDLHAYPEAEAQYEAAMRVARSKPGAFLEQEADTLHKFGQVQRGLGNQEGALRSYGEALNLYRDMGVKSGAAQVLFSIGGAYMAWGQPAQALEALQGAREAAGEEKRLLGRIAASQAQNLDTLRHYPQSAEAIAKALAFADESGDKRLSVLSHIASGWHQLATLDMQRAITDFSIVLQAPEAPLHARMAAESRCALALVGAGRLDEAEKRAGLAQKFFERMDEPVGTPEGQYLIDQRDPYEFGLSCAPTAAVYLARGRFHDAVRFIDGALEKSGSPASILVIIALVPMLAAAELQLGRYREAEERLKLFFVQSQGQGRPPVIVRAFNALLAAGQGTEAKEIAENIPSSSTSYKLDIQALPPAVIAAETGVLLRLREPAESQYDGLRELYQRGMLFSIGYVVLLPRLLGAICILRGDWQAAQTYLSEALDVATRTQALPELALTHLEYADLYSRQSPSESPSLAQSHLSEAKQLLSRLDLKLWKRRLNSIEDAVVGPLPGRGARGKSKETR